jgi:hypothetical protein
MPYKEPACKSRACRGAFSLCQEAGKSSAAGQAPLYNININININVNIRVNDGINDGDAGRAR